MGFEAPGAPQTQEIEDFRPAQNSCIKNPDLVTRASFALGLFVGADWQIVRGGTDWQIVRRGNKIQRALEFCKIHVADASAPLLRRFF
jgi:hypothetical protein